MHCLGGSRSPAGLAWLALAVCLAGAPVAAKVKVFPAKDARLTDYKTYHWEPIRVLPGRACSRTTWSSPR